MSLFDFYIPEWVFVSINLLIVLIVISGDVGIAIIIGKRKQQDIPSQIQKLAELNRSGVLTDDEFQAKKVELLKKL